MEKRAKAEKVTLTHDSTREYRRDLEYEDYEAERAAQQEAHEEAEAAFKAAKAAKVLL